MNVGMQDKCFSNSLIIQQIITKEIITVTVVENLILISIDFNDFFFLLLNFSFD